MTERIPALFFNGSVFAVEAVRPWLTGLAPWAAFAQDLRGAGTRALETSSFTIADLAEDGLGWIGAAPRVHVVGVSMGGLVAQQFAARWPQRTASLALLSTHPGAAHRVHPQPEDQQVWTQESGDPAHDMAARLRLALGPAHLARRPEAPQRMAEAFLRGGAAGAGSAGSAGSTQGRALQNAAMESFDAWDLLPAIAAPALILTGEADRVVPPENSRRLAARIPSGSLEMLPGVGHLLLVEAGAEVSRRLKRFWAAVEGLPG